MEGKEEKEEEKKEEKEEEEEKNNFQKHRVNSCLKTGSGSRELEIFRQIMTS